MRCDVISMTDAMVLVMGLSRWGMRYVNDGLRLVCLVECSMCSVLFV